MEPNYKINLKIFEGPLDLLLHLIKKNDLEISDIPISLILDQYMEYLGLMRELDIDLAGDFILLASELTHIKSQMLLQRDDEGEEEPDPRADLVARLLEYQKYKRAAQWLNDQPLLFRDVYKRTNIDKPEELEQEDEAMEVEPFALLNAFHEILKRAPQGHIHEIEAERISVTDRIYQIVEQLKDKESILFEELFPSGYQRPDIIITFLAILEMARLRMVQIYQMDFFGVIRVRRIMEVEEDRRTIDG